MPLELELGIGSGRDSDDRKDGSLYRLVESPLEARTGVGGAGFEPRVGRISLASSRTKTASSCLLSRSTASRTPYFANEATSG